MAPAALSADAQSSALAVAMQMANALSAAAGAMGHAVAGSGTGSSVPWAAPKKTLEELFARDRARIAAAEQRNLAYVAEQQNAAKVRAKAAASAAKAALSASVAVTAAPVAEAAYADGGESAPPAKMARLEAAPTVSNASAASPAPSSKLAPRSAAGGAAACSVYVSQLPADVEAGELQAHMERVGPVVRVKLYRDGHGLPKGDALITYQKDAAVLGAIQLLHTTGAISMRSP